MCIRDSSGAIKLTCETHSAGGGGGGGGGASLQEILSALIGIVFSAELLLLDRLPQATRKQAQVAITKRCLIFIAWWVRLVGN
jgi:hypothetical protein